MTLSHLRQVRACCDVKCNVQFKRWQLAAEIVLRSRKLEYVKNTDSVQLRHCMNRCLTVLAPKVFQT